MVRHKQAGTEIVKTQVPYIWVCSSNGRVIPSQGIGSGIDARLIQLFFFVPCCLSIMLWLLSC